MNMFTDKIIKKVNKGMVRIAMKGLYDKGNENIKNVSKAIRKGYAKEFHAALLQKIIDKVFIDEPIEGEEEIKAGLILVIKRICERTYTPKDADYLDNDFKKFWDRLYHLDVEKLNRPDFDLNSLNKEASHGEQSSQQKQVDDIH